MSERSSNQRMLATAGLVIGLLAWPAFGIFFGHSLGDIFAEDPVEEARLIAQQELIATSAEAVFLIFLPLAAWIAGRTFGAHRFLSLLTAASVFGLSAFLIGLLVMG